VAAIFGGKLFGRSVLPASAAPVLNVLTQGAKAWALCFCSAARQPLDG